MAEVAPPPAAASLRRELEFVRALLKSGRSVEEMVAAANAAARVAARCVEETKRSQQKGGSELCIRGLPTGQEWDWRGLKRWLQSRGLSQRSIKYADKEMASDVGVVRFASEADCSSAADLLATAEPPVGGGPLRIERGMPPEFAGKSRKREREEDEGQAQAARFKKAARAPDVCEAVCPWWRVPYPKQLTDKHARVVSALADVTAEVDRRTHGGSKPEWVRAARGASSGSSAPVCCPLLGILRSPGLERYRNKSEFTSGLDEHEKPEVGFLRGAFTDGITAVGSPAPTRHTSAAAVRLAAAAADYLRNTSQFPVYDKRRHEGYWRLVLVREGSAKTFLPLPVAASPSSSSAPAATPAVIESPTFATLDPFTYLVTFGEQQQQPAEAAAAAEGAAAEGMEVDAAAAAPAAAEPAEAGRGMHVSQVSEAEPERPLPDEVLVMLQVNPNYTRALAEPAAAARELRGMAAALQAAASAGGLRLSTVRVQYHTGVSNAAPFDAPLMEVPAAPEAEAAEGEGVAAAVDACRGPGYIHDSLCELKFRISPTAFFQVNSAATCVLYKVVSDWAAARPNSLLLDICCGTGTIGLTLASKVSKVVGIDSVASAVEDARVNAALNGISNAEFIAAKAEDALPGVLASHVDGDEALGAGDVVAVADPPRAGLHRSVLRALLGCDKIRRLVFVSCNPENLVANLAALCSPPVNHNGSDRGGSRSSGRGRGGRGGRGGGPDAGPAFGGSYTPFRPVKAVALDLFPHTAHVEAVVLLER